MAEMYSKEHLEYTLSNKSISKELKNVCSKLKNRKLSENDKKVLLSNLSVYDILVGYYNDLFNNIFYLLPESYKNDEELVFMACLKGDNIETMSNKLKNSYSFARFLVYHISSAVKFVKPEFLSNPNSRILMIMAEEHLDVFEHIPQVYINEDIIITSIKNFRGNQFKDFGEYIKPEYPLLKNIPDKYKKSRRVAYLASEEELCLLYYLDPKVVAELLASDEDKFNEYYKYLHKKQVKLEQLHEKNPNNKNCVNELRRIYNQEAELFNYKSIIFENSISTRKRNNKK